MKKQTLSSLENKHDIAFQVLPSSNGVAFEYMALGATVLEDHSEIINAFEAAYPGQVNASHQTLLGGSIEIKRIEKEG